MPLGIAQIIITVRIDTNEAVTYNYTDPNTKRPVDWSPRCVLDMKQPTFCLFQLESATVTRGWSIKQLFPNGTPLVPNEAGPFDFSVNTYFDGKETTNYQFFIMYHNSLTNESLFADPQELNEPPMDCPPK